MTWLNTSSFTLYLLSQPLKAVSSRLQARRSNPPAQRQSLGTDEQRPRRSQDNQPGTPLNDDTDSADTHEGSVLLHRNELIFSTQEVARIALEFCALWFMANFLVSKALEHTTVASCTIFTSTSGLWTLLFGVLGNVERFSFRKLLAVLLALLGIIVVSASDLSGNSHASTSQHSPLEILVGDLCSLGSAVLVHAPPGVDLGDTANLLQRKYGLYTVLLKRRAGSVERIDMLLFFGFVGAFDILVLWPGLFILDRTGIEPFELPPSKAVWIILLVGSVDRI